MKNVLILDCETTGLQPPEAVTIEIGCILWNIEHHSILECYSALIPHHENPAEPYNGISVGLLGEVPNRPAWNIAHVNDMAERADAVIAHSATFDKKFCDAIPIPKLTNMPWICTLEDVEWPKATKLSLGRAGSGSLVRLALMHGVAVTSAHRSIHDCLLLTRLFEAVPDIDERLEAGLIHAQLPKASFVATVPYERNAEVKLAGFHWDGDKQIWHRYMAVDDAEELAFPVVFEEDYWEQQRQGAST